MPVPIDMVAMSCSRRIRRRTPLGDICLEIAKSCVFLSVWFQRERFETLLAVNIMGHAFSSHGADGEWHGSRELGTSNGGSSLCGDEELPWCSVTWSIEMQVGRLHKRNLKFYFFKVKIHGLALISCA
jgi:hypothetical protein